MRRYRVVASPQFRRDLRKLDAETHQRILNRLEQLETDPAASRQLAAVKSGTWRVRVGDYRIRYDIEGDGLSELVPQADRDVRSHPEPGDVPRRARSGHPGDRART